MKSESKDPALESIHKRFTSLVSNPTMNELALEPVWTISAPQDIEVMWSDDTTHTVNRKTPLNISAALNNRIYGARPNDPDATTDLPALHSLIPHIDTWAFKLDVSKYHFVLIDIEPSASKELVDQLLTLPYLYGERSMSGKGIHLLVDSKELETTASWLDFETLPKIQRSDKQVEILMREHWVTFTGNTLDKPCNPHGTGSVRDFFNAMVDDHGKVRTLRVLSDELAAMEYRSFTHHDDIPYEDDIITLTWQLMCQNYDSHNKLESFNHDMSRYELSVIHYLKKYMLAAMHSSNIITKYKYTDADLAHMMYDALTADDYATMDTKEIIEPRDKWFSRRPGGTYLTQQIKHVLAGDDHNIKLTNIEQEQLEYNLRNQI